MFIPAMVMLQVVMELLKPFTGGSISWTNMWIYFGLGIIGAVIVFLCNKNDYKKDLCSLLHGKRKYKDCFGRTHPQTAYERV